MYLSISLYSFTVCWFIPLYVSVCLNIYTSKDTFLLSSINWGMDAVWKVPQTIYLFRCAYIYSGGTSILFSTNHLWAVYM